MSRTWKDQKAFEPSTQHAKDRASAIREVRKLKAQYAKSRGEKAMAIAHRIVTLVVAYSL